MSSQDPGEFDPTQLPLNASSLATAHPTSTRSQTSLLSSGILYERRKSAKACSVCRARILRRDTVAHGAPCSNYKYDEWECAMPLKMPRIKGSEVQTQGSLVRAIAEAGLAYSHNCSDDELSQIQKDHYQSIDSTVPILPVHTPMWHGPEYATHMFTDLLPLEDGNNDLVRWSEGIIEFGTPDSQEIKTYDGHSPLAEAEFDDYFEFLKLAIAGQEQK